MKCACGTCVYVCMWSRGEVVVVAGGGGDTDHFSPKLQGSSKTSRTFLFVCLF